MTKRGSTSRLSSFLVMKKGWTGLRTSRGLLEPTRTIQVLWASETPLGLLSRMVGSLYLQLSVRDAVGLLLQV